MLYKEALKLIIPKPKVKYIKSTTNGYMVSFTIRENGLLKSEHFPEKGKGEWLISTVKEAWALAEWFADNVDKNKIANVYVIDSNYNPVDENGVRTITLPTYTQRKIFNKY